MPKIAVILSGSGVQDGAEIHESVLVLLALDRLGCEVVCAAPDIAQRDVVDHVAGQATKERRNVLVESARIARGTIVDVAKLAAADFDATILPGGFGAAKNLCSFAEGGADWEVDGAVARFLRSMRAADKPIGALCIAPAILAKLFGAEGVALTIGDDAGTAARLAALGAKHVDCPVDGIVVDPDQRIVTTPAYMLAARISDVARGIDKLCAAVVKMTQ